MRLLGGKRCKRCGGPHSSRPFTLLALGLLTIYGPALRSGFDLAPGDAGDARIMIFLLESTWRALLAGRSPLSPPMFFPVPGVLGYTDAHLLWVPIYGAFRLAGLAPMRAFSALFVVLSAFGFLCAWRLLQRVLGLASAAAAVGAFLFVFSNALTIKLGHGQMIGVAILPAILLLLHAAWARGRPWLAAAAGVLTGLLAATSYEVAWFFLFLGALATLLGLLAWPDFRAALRQPALRRVGIGFGAGLAVGLMPFCVIYGPQILSGRHRAPGDAELLSPVPVGPAEPRRQPSGVQGPARAGSGCRTDDSDTDAERFMGSSVPVWALAAAGLGLLWRGRRRASMPRRALLAGGGGGDPLHGTRVQARPPHLALDRRVLRQCRGRQRSAPPSAPRSWRCCRSPPAPGWHWMRYSRGRGARSDDGRSWSRPSCCCRSRRCWNRCGTPRRTACRRRGRRRWWQGLPAPPARCSVFGLAPQPPGARPWWKLQSDALMFSLHWRLPTVNGNSSWTPPGWGLRQPASADYAAALAGWVRGHRLGPAFCAFRADQRRWLDPSELARLLD